MRDVLKAHTDLIGFEASAELSRVDPGATWATLLRRPGCSCWGSRAKERTGSARRTDAGLEICTHCIRREEAHMHRREKALATVNWAMQRMEDSIPLRSEGRNEANRR